MTNTRDTIQHLHSLVDPTSASCRIREVSRSVWNRRR
jgi:hypothetical protein